MKPIVTKIVLAAIIFKERKALILQRAANDDVFPGLWELPSGKREAFEKVEDGLAREVEEETGLKIDDVVPSSVFNYQVEKETEIRDTVQINFRAQWTRGEVELSEEHQNFAWVDYNEINHYDISAETKAAIIKASIWLSQRKKT